MAINIRRGYRSSNSSSLILDKFSLSSKEDHHEFILQVSHDLIMVKLRKGKSSWWSPELNLRVESEGENSRLYETVGPNASTFTLAMFFIILGIALFMMAVTWLIVQLQLGEPSLFSLIWSVISLLVVVGTWIVLAYGRLRARDQVQQIRRFVGNILTS